jgi:hypothetical protein
VYQHTTPYFELPDGSLVATTANLTETVSGVTGDTATNYYFRVEAVDCVNAGDTVSNPVGEFDFAIVPGTP